MKKLIELFKKKDIKSKTLLKNIIISFSIKGVGLFVSLFTMPSYIKFFNNEVILGVWFTAISILNWVLSFDFGLSNGLRNLLVEPLKKNDNIEAKKYISSTYGAILGLVILFLVLSIIIFPTLNWNSIYNISNTIINNNVLIFMSQILFIGILFNFLFNIINSIFYAMQKSFIPSLLNLISTILILLFINVFNSGNIVQNIKVLSIINALFSNLPLLIATIILFLTKLKDCKPSLKYFDKNYAKKIVNLGMTFFWLQILTMLMYGFNEFLISHLTNPSNVVQYQIYNKLFSLISTLFNLAMTPVWSAVREACVEKDVKWIKKINKIINLSFIPITLLEVILIFLLQFIVDIWLGKDYLMVNYLFASIFAISTLLQMKMTVDTSFSNGFGKLKMQSIALTITTILKFALSYILIKMYHNWIFIVIANIISIIPFIIILYFDINNQCRSIGENIMLKKGNE